MLKGELLLGYFKGPEGDIVSLIKAEPEEKYTLGKVIRFNPEGMTLSHLYHKNIREVLAFYKAHCEELDKGGMYACIEEFIREFEEMTGYRKRDLCDNLS